jgi:hypothetical protein
VGGRGPNLSPTRVEPASVAADPEMTTAVTMRVVKKLALRMPASKAPLASTIPGPARALQVTAFSGGLLLHRGVSQMIQYGQTLERGGRSSGRLSGTATTTPIVGVSPVATTPRPASLP